MKVLITGGGGQLGRALAGSKPADADIFLHDAKAFDVTDPDAVAATMDGVRPELLINAAAYTAVDRAEGDEERATAVNTNAVGLLAEAARRHRTRFVHVSTDFVFAGDRSTPYPPDAATAPLSVYGRTKRDGERAAGADALIVRTAWLYASTGANFVRTMLRLMSSRPEVRVVADQIGSPTYADNLAAAIWALADQNALGIHHYTDSGVASWYDFAVAIQEEALALGLLPGEVAVMPIATEDYPTPARRPSYSVLDCRATWSALGTPAPHWRAGLRRMLREVQLRG